MSILWKCTPVNTGLEGADGPVKVQTDWHGICTEAEPIKERTKNENYTRFGRLERHVQRLREKITAIFFGRQSKEL